MVLNSDSYTSRITMLGLLLLRLLGKRFGLVNIVTQATVRENARKRYSVFDLGVLCCTLHVLRRER